MKDQHEKIKGYRDLSQAEIDLMNEIKQKAEETGVLVDKLINFNDSQSVKNADGSVVSVDYRWVAIGKTDLQKGFMALVRAIAKPESF